MTNKVMFGFVLTAFCTDAEGNLSTEDYSSFGKDSSFKVSAGFDSGYEIAAKIDRPLKGIEAFSRAKAWAKRRAKTIGDGEESTAKQKHTAEKK